MKKSRRVLVILACVLALCVAGLLAVVAKNQMAASFDELSETDQTVLSEYNTLFESLSEDDVWDGFGLEDKTILALAGDWGDGYLINPAEPVSSIFAKEISLPDGWPITVYRVSMAEPGLMPLRLAGNFNTVGETYSLYGSPLYFVKYGSEASSEEKEESEPSREVIYLPEDDADLDLSQIVYDYLCLALPPQRFHPDGECNPEVLKYLADGIKVEGKDKTGNPFSVLEGFLADKKE